MRIYIYTIKIHYFNTSQYKINFEHYVHTNKYLIYYKHYYRENYFKGCVFYVLVCLKNIL